MSIAGVRGLESEEGGEPQIYVPNWQKVLTNSNLASSEEKLEWLLNCVPSGVSEGYDTLKEGSVIELDVQSALLVKET